MLRKTNISPGPESNTRVGSTRLSEQAMTIVRGDWPCTSRS
jgi:hypothetical protein